ncbi:MAG TPA: HAD family phosphatase [Pseudonocardiaceae bacterium]|nr:HAD family phosphatase [Pseudonocardiaceae bacterium]
MAGRAIDAVVFDYGGVLTAPVRTSTDDWLAREGIDVAGYRATMRAWLVDPDREDSPVRQLERGVLAPEEFERVFAARLTTAAGGPVVAEGLLGRMFALMVPDPVMLRLIGELRGAGLRVGLLSNSWGATGYPADVLGACDPVVISGTVGLRKPDPAIFELLLERLGVPAGRTAFVDDVKPNVAAADGLGMHGVLHVDATTTRAALRALVPDLPADPPSGDVTA